MCVVSKVSVSLSTSGTGANIDKFSQLERNLQEDFARDDVTEYAKGGDKRRSLLRFDLA